MPTRFFVVKMTETGAKYRKPCNKTPDTTWCNHCGFCKICINTPEEAKVQLIAEEDQVMTPDLSINEFCPKHNALYGFFCSKHDSILCRICLQSLQRDCKISTLDEPSKGAKTSTALSNLEQEVQAISSSISSGLRGRDDVLSVLKNEDEILRREVKETREELNKHLDKLQNKMYHDIEEKKNGCISEVNKVHVSLTLKQSRIENISKKISLLKSDRFSDRQTFIATRTYGKIISKEKLNVSEEFAKCNDYHIKFNRDEHVSNFTRVLMSLGDVVVETRAEPAPFSESWQRQAQLHVASTTYVGKVGLQRQMSIHLPKKSPIHMSPSLTSCVILPNKTMVFVDDVNETLVVHNRDGKYMTDISLPDCGRPFDITRVDENRVAVTYGVKTTSGKIAVINIETNIQEKTISNCFSGTVWGLSFREEKFYVVENGGSAVNVKIIGKNGDICKTLPLSCKKVYDITTSEDKIHYISTDTNTLYTCDQSGNLIWKVFEPKFCEQKFFRGSYSTSLCTDRHGNVFVSIPDAMQIMMISKDGKNKKIILEKSEKLESPSGLSFLHETEQLLVCNVSDRYAVIFDVKY